MIYYLGNQPNNEIKQHVETIVNDLKLQNEIIFIYLANHILKVDDINYLGYCYSPKPYSGAFEIAAMDFPEDPEYTTIKTLAHELRHVWHFKTLFSEDMENDAQQYASKYWQRLIPEPNIIFV